MIENFLNQYKELEQAVRKIYGENYTVWDYENNQIDIEDKPLLTQCRSLRNFIVHNPNKNYYLIPTEDATLFLKELSDKILSSVLSCKDKMLRLRKFYIEKDKIYDVACACKSNNSYMVPIVDDNKIILGIFNTNVLLNTVINDISVKKAIKYITLDKNFITVKPTLPYEECPNLAYVTEDGTKNTKLLGVIYK
ncbi:MAG: hypothetical protein ACLT4F_08165 [Clostridia bacterium]